MERDDSPEIGAAPAGDNLPSTGDSTPEEVTDWKPLAEIPRPGGWQRLAAKMGYHHTDPYLMQRVESRRRQRRSDGLIRQARLDAPEQPTSQDVTDLMSKMDEVMDMLTQRGRGRDQTGWKGRRVVEAPDRPKPPPTAPKPLPGRTGKGGVQLP